MKAIANSKKNIRIKEIDVGDGSTPVAKQFEIESLPTVWLYDGKTRIAEGREDVLARLE